MRYHTSMCTYFRHTANQPPQPQLAHCAHGREARERTGRQHELLALAHVAVRVDLLEQDAELLHFAVDLVLRRRELPVVVIVVIIV